MGKDDQYDPVVDKPKKREDSKTIEWEKTRPFPDLARTLADRRGDVAKVEHGFEIKGGIRFEGYLLSIVRPIGTELKFFTQVYPKAKFRGYDTALQFKKEAYTFFEEEHTKWLKSLN